MGSFSGWLMATANEKASTDDDTTTCFILARQMSGAELIQVAEYLTIKLKTIDGQDWRVVIGIALYAACVPHEEVGTQTPAMPQKKGKLLKT
jgi:hypothetical protein